MYNTLFSWCMRVVLPQVALPEEFDVDEVWCFRDSLSVSLNELCVCRHLFLKTIKYTHKKSVFNLPHTIFIMDDIIQNDHTVP